MDDGLQENEVGADVPSKRVKGRTKPTEPKKCPQHRFDQKTFLNPICDDCLLAEVNSHPPPDEETGLFPAAPVTHADNGEGLVWDSEVKVEIQSRISHESRVTDAPIVVDSDGPDDVDRRILESHVEVTVEVDNYSVSGTEGPSSPLLASSQTAQSSPSSSMATSPPTSTEKQQKQFRLSPAPRRKRYGLTFHDGFSTDFEDGQDDEDDALHAISPPSRGRAVVRGSGSGSAAQRTVTDPITALPPVESKSSRKPMSRFKSLRSISSPFRHSPKSKQQDTVTENVAEKPVLKRSKSRNPFRAFRRGKSSRLPTEMDDTTPVLPTNGSRESLHELKSFGLDIKPSTRPTRPPRKSSRKDWKPIKDQSRQEIDRPSLNENSRDPAPLSPTSPSWSRDYFSDRDEDDRPILALPLEAEPFDAQSIFSDFEVEGTAGFSQENAATPALMVPATPESSKVSPMRAMIEGIEAFDLGFDLGLDDGMTKELRSEPGTPWDNGHQSQYLGLAITSSEPELVEPNQEQVVKSASMEAGPTETLSGSPQQILPEVTTATTDQTREAAPEQERPEPAETLVERSREPSPEDSARIISMYGWSTNDQKGDLGKNNEVVLEVSEAARVSRREPVIEEEPSQTEEFEVDHEEKEPEVSTTTTTTTPPGSPTPTAKAFVATGHRHPPRKSSLKRLTGFNHTHMPFADFDFPVPRSPLLQQAFETEES